MTTIVNRFVSAALLLLVLRAPVPAWAQGTVAPVAKQQFFDSNGHPLAFGKLYVYAAGTTTPTPIYADSALLVQLANPAILDLSGRLTYFLGPSTYRFALKTSADALVWDVDGVSAVSPFNVNLDIQGTAGEALSAGDVVYLSDGSGSKTAGRWYKASATNAYSSSEATVVGMVPAAVTSGASGSIRLSGSLTTASSVSVGVDYYVATTAGAVTATVPTSNARKLGRTDTTASIILTETPTAPIADTSVECFRITLTSGVPVTTADVTAATTLYATPKGCNLIGLADSAGTTTVRASAEFSVAVPATTSQMYSVFAYANSGVPTLELAPWTNDTTPGTAAYSISSTTGYYTKTGDLTRRYLAVFRTTTVSGQTEDSASKRYLSNHYHRAPRLLQRTTTGNWPYTSATIRQANATAANQVDVVVGVADVLLDLRLMVLASNASAGGAAFSVIGIGEDSTTTITGLNNIFNSDTAGNIHPLGALLIKYPAVGRHVYSWNEAGDGVNVSTFFGNSLTSQSGLMGRIEG